MGKAIMKLAIERLYQEVELLKKSNADLVQKVAMLEKGSSNLNVNEEIKPKEDELIDTKQVLNYLGICYNTLQSIIKKGLINPIRINQRRIRFSKKSVLLYISGLNGNCDANQ